MAIGVVEHRLNQLLESDKPKVLLLTGGWGAGKTYQWKRALRRAAEADFKARYAYVSLFGIGSVAELRKRVTEELVAHVDVPGQARTVVQTLDDAGWRLKPLQLVKLLPLLPVIGKLEGLANELSFLAVRNAVICLDDLERRNPSLKLADVLGLASFLKEERGCRVVLISDAQKIDPDGRDELSLYLEKVVDEKVEFAPTPQEACTIALGESPCPACVLLRDKICALNVSNVRVISRLAAMAADLEALLAGLHENALQEAIHTLALFGVCHFLPSKDFPSLQFLKTLENEWAQFYQLAKKATLTAEDQLKKRWMKSLEDYGFGATSPFDLELAQGLEAGFFDEDKIRLLATELSERHGTMEIASKYNEALRRFFHSLNGDGQQVLRELREIALSAVSAISPSDLQVAFDIFTEAGQSQVANELLEAYIAGNQHRPAVFDQVDGAFSDTFKEDFASRLREEGKKHKALPSIQDALDRIDFDHGWNPADIRMLGEATRADIEAALLGAEGKLFRTRIKTLLHIGQLTDATDDEKRVSAQTLEFLRSLAEKDPVVAIRLRRFLPAEKEKNSSEPGT